MALTKITGQVINDTTGLVVGVTTVIPITTVVVEAGAVYIPTVVTPTFAFVFNLNVFAIL